MFHLNRMGRWITPTIWTAMSKSKAMKFPNPPIGVNTRKLEGGSRGYGADLVGPDTVFVSLRESSTAPFGVLGVGAWKT